MIIDKILFAPFRGLVQTAVAKSIDAQLTKLAPRLWPAIKHALPGWKTAVGLIISDWPTIVGAFVEVLHHASGVLIAVGVTDHEMDPGAAIRIMGRALLYLGILDKVIKAAMKYLGVADEDKQPLGGGWSMTTERAGDFYAKKYRELRAAGETFESARDKAGMLTATEYPDDVTLKG